MPNPANETCRLLRAVAVFTMIATFVAVVSADDTEPGQTARRHRAHDARPLRPALSISDRILPIQLVDTTDGYVRVPKRNNLRPATLLATLGSDFDPTFMAQNKPATLIEEPSDAVAGSTADSASNAKLAAEIKNLNLSEEILDATSDAIRAFERWLLDRASCPVRYVWDDVGPLFWPRWIKRGECVNVPGRSCSWPEGQRCVPAESLTVHLLRWHCRPRKGAASARSRSDGAGSSTAIGASVRSKANTVLAGRRSRKPDNKMYRCQWLKVPYPVTAECFCSC